MRVFLFTLAVGDDVGTLLLIAVLYTGDLDLAVLAVTVLGLLVVVERIELRVWRGPAQLVEAVVARRSGVDPTLLGVAMALITPAYPPELDTVEDEAFRSWVENLSESAFLRVNRNNQLASYLPLETARKTSVA